MAFEEKYVNHNKKMERQDFLDNSIFDLIQTLNQTNIEIDSGIEMIAEVRDAIANVFEDKGICKEEDLYC